MIIDKCLQGDRKAQIELYKIYYKAMYNTSLRIVNNTADAEDIMQEAFISAFAKLHTFDGSSAFGAWLKKIVVNKSIDFLKKRKIETVDMTNINIPEEETTDSVTAFAEIKAAEIKKAISELPDGYRVILSLYLLEGYDHDEIAEIMNITSSTSRSQYTRAKRKLAGLLENKQYSHE